MATARWFAVVSWLALGAGGCGSRAGNHHTPERAVARVMERRIHAYARLEARFIDTAAPAAAATRRAAHRCLGDWRAAPPERWDELLAVYELALARPTLPAQRADALREIAALAPVARLSRQAGLRDIPAALGADVARLTRLLAPTIPLCAIVTEWRAAGWAQGRRPSVLRRVDRRRADDTAAARITGHRLHRDALVLRRTGGKAALPAASAILHAFEPADGKDYCHDPVFDLLASDDTFCGRARPPGLAAARPDGYHVSQRGGSALYSRHTASGFRLVVERDGRRRVVPGVASSRPLQADVGTDARGRTVGVLAACGRARCALRRLDVRTRSTSALAVGVRCDGGPRWPAVFRGRVTFACAKATESAIDEIALDGHGGARRVISVSGQISAIDTGPVGAAFLSEALTPGGPSPQVLRLRRRGGGTVEIARGTEGQEGGTELLPPSFAGRALVWGTISGEPARGFRNRVSRVDVRTGAREVLDVAGASLLSVSADGHDPAGALLVAEAPAPARGFDPDPRRQVVTRLLIPRFRPASPVHAITEHRCGFEDVHERPWGFGIAVVKTRAMTCAAGARLLRAVAPHLQLRDFPHLGLRGPLPIRGYRCRAFLTGDSAWRILCRRGDRSVVGFTAN